MALQTLHHFPRFPTVDYVSKGLSCDVIVVQKSSSREKKFTFYGWDYSFPHTLCAKLDSWATAQSESIL